MAPARKVVVHTDKAGKWRWTALSRNGKKVGDSGEGYENEEHAIRMARDLFPTAELIVDRTEGLSFEDETDPEVLDPAADTDPETT